MKISSVFRIFISGVKKNYKAALILQAFALSVVLAYYFIPPWAALLDRLGNFKAQGGYLFSGVVTLLFGGVFPYVIFVLSGQIKGRERWTHLAFFVLFWFWKGMEVDLLYRIQGWLFGTEPSFFIVLIKMIVDQFVYGPLWAAPTMTLFYLWKDSGFSVKKMKSAVEEVGLLQRIATVLVSNMIVWIPSVCIIYSLPMNLQLPLFNIVLLFWGLILHFVVQQGGSKKDSEDQGVKGGSGS